MSDLTEIDFVRPWRELRNEEERAGLQKRLQFEVSQAHLLWGRLARIIGRSDANDDIVVATADNQFAIVHLVWGQSPGDEKWPATQMFSTPEELSHAMREWSQEAGFLDE